MKLCSKEKRNTRSRTKPEGPDTFLIHLTLALSYKERECESLPLIGEGQDGVSESMKQH